MSATRTVPQVGPGHGHEVRVHIGLDTNGNIVVDPDPFWIYRHQEEQVRWVCVQRHTHGDENHPCFTVDFDKGTGSPFERSHFQGHGDLSDLPTSGAAHNKEYKYTIRINGKELDPIGGVRD
jgi:hypothetical protein